MEQRNAQEIQPRSNLGYNIVTGDETWIYSYEPESKQQFTVWVFQNEPKPKVVRSHSAAKQMIACFFGYTRHVTGEKSENFSL